VVVHGAGAAIFGGFLYLFDVAFRWWLTTDLRKKLILVDAKASPEGFVTLSFPKKSFNYAPGQYIFVGIPVISLWEAHPFSISSSPYQETVTIHIRPSGDWTNALERLARRETKIQVTLQGPYGNALTEFEDIERTTYVFIAGGIGANPLLSMANQLIFQKFRGKSIEKIYFYWSFREPNLPCLFLAPDEFLFSYQERLDQFHGTFSDQSLKDSVHIQLFCTHRSPSGVSPVFEKHLQPGHLDIPATFKNIDSGRKGRPEGSVCVIGCGPESMALQISQLSKLYGFAHHLETFSY